MRQTELSWPLLHCTLQTKDGVCVLCVPTMCYRPRDQVGSDEVRI